MIDLQPAPVPELSEEWIVSHRSALFEAVSRTKRTPLRWVALAGSTGVAATVTTLVLAGGSAQSAFAGWSASPTAPASGQLTSADTDCQAYLAQLPPSSSMSTDAASLVPKLSDVRGPYTLTLLGDGSRSEALCISALGNATVLWIPLSGVPVSPGAIAVDRISSGTRSVSRTPWSLGGSGQA